MPTTPPPLPRSRFVTILAWFIIVVSGLLIPISVISQMMIMVGSYGTKTSDPLGWLIVVACPPVTFVAGIGLLKRWRWAWFYMVVLFAAIAASNLHHAIQGAKPSFEYVGADGVRTTVMTSPPSYFVPLIVISALLLIKLLSGSVRAEFAFPSPPASAIPPLLPSENRDGWRVGHHGRDCMYYEELRDGKWEQIEIGGEMLMGRAHHVIYFASPEEWQRYPEWARHRRAEIIARIQSAFREPDYEYHGL